MCAGEASWIAQTWAGIGDSGPRKTTNRDPGRVYFFFVPDLSGVWVRTDAASVLASCGVAFPVWRTLDAIDATDGEVFSFLAISRIFPASYDVAEPQLRV